MKSLMEMVTEAKRIKHTVGKILTKIESRTTREQYKTEYGQIIEFGKFTYKCEIVLKNPLNLTDKSTKEQLTNLINNMDLSEENFDDILSMINGNSYTTAFRYIRKYLSFNELKNMFDGVIGYADSDGGGKEYIVYSPNNIKILSIE